MILAGGLFINTRIYFCCFLFLCFFSNPSFSQEITRWLPEKYQVKLDVNGHVPFDFWSYQIQITESEDAIKPIETNLDLLQQKPFDWDDENQEGVKPRYHRHYRVGSIPTPVTKSAKRQVEVLIELLKNNKIELTDLTGISAEQAISRYAIKEMGDSGLYMWEICGKFFVINRKKPTQLILFESFTNKDGALGDITAQKLSENVYRVFFPTSSGEVGCGLSLTNLYIYDFDFNRNICRQFQYPDGSFAKDLNEDGNNQLILFPEVGGGVHWPWVYFWDGKKWINESLKYWKFYKNGTIGPRGICPGETIKEILNAFNLAVQNDEPLRYWKQTEKGN